MVKKHHLPAKKQLKFAMRTRLLYYSAVKTVENAVAKGEGDDKGMKRVEKFSTVRRLPGLRRPSIRNRLPIWLRGNCR